MDDNTQQLSEEYCHSYTSFMLQNINTCGYDISAFKKAFADRERKTRNMRMLGNIAGPILQI